MSWPFLCRARYKADMARENERERRNRERRKTEREETEERQKREEREKRAEKREKRANKKIRDEIIEKKETIRATREETTGRGKQE